MAKIFDRLTDSKKKDIRVLCDFISIFCRENHRGWAKEVFPVTEEKLRHVLGDKELRLCHDCGRLLEHGIAKLLLCSYEPKPMCKNCSTHCYAPGYREKVREVMKFSGRYLIRHGRLDLLLHYLR